MVTASSLYQKMMLSSVTFDIGLNITMSPHLFKAGSFQDEVDSDAFLRLPIAQGCRSYDPVFTVASL